MSEKLEIPLDVFHQHEALDRTHLVLCMIDDHLLSHPFVAQHPKIEKKIKEAARCLADAYQRIGTVNDDECI